MSMLKKILLLTVFMLALDQFVIFFAAALFGPAPNRSEMQMAQVGVVQALVLYGFYIVVVRILNSATFPEFRIREAVHHTFIGVGLSIFMLALCLILTPELYHAKSSFRMLPWSQILMPLCAFTALAISEEIAYRGVLQRILSKFLPVHVATIIQIALFVQAHWSAILGDSAPILRVIGLASFALLATMMAKRSQYLIMPITFHIGENFFSKLVMGHYSGLRWDIPGIWSYQEYLRISYRPFITLIICLAVWYWPKIIRKKPFGT